MASLKEECGIVAAYQMGSSPRNVSPYIVRGLLELQNRGQLSAGLTSYNPERGRILQTHKDVGTVQEVFRLHSVSQSRRLMEDYGGIAAIGHNRYATSGTEESSFAQPFERVHGRMWKWFAIAFNGNLANYDELKENLEAIGYHITYHTDTEVMMHYINKELRGDERPPFTEVFANVAKVFDGAYSIAFIDAAGDLVVLRDPLGIKPLCYGVRDDLLVAASESVALSALGIDNPRMLAPGEMLTVNRDGYQVERYWPAEQTRHCFFEWVYFANLATSLEDRSVYRVRREIGRELAALEDREAVRDHLVVSVPETANAMASSYGFHLGLPVVEGLLRNRYMGRTFIDGSNRLDAVRMKFTPLREILEGRKILLVDDTLVRGTTLKTVIHDLRARGGVAEVHVRIGNPPIMGPCFYGIDMPTVSELFAPTFLDGRPHDDLPPDTLAQMAAELGADSLRYLPTEALVRAIGLPKGDLCMACINAQYPTAVGARRHRAALEEFHAPWPAHKVTSISG